MARWVVGAWLIVCTGASAAEVSLLTSETPWRVWSATGPALVVSNNLAYARSPGGKPTPLVATNAWTSEVAPSGWFRNDYDDRVWGRYGPELTDFAGLYGRDFGWRVDRSQPALLCLRTRFGVSEPARASDLKLVVQYVGGVVVYVNGAEVGRGHLPAGPIEAYTPATMYPAEAYTLESGTSPLPPVQMGMRPEPALVSRFQLRARSLTVNIPARVLVAGANSLALELHRAPVNLDAPMPHSRYVWWHVGFGGAQLTSAIGAGVIAYDTARQGPRVWSAQTIETITDNPKPRQILDRGGESIVLRGAMNQGIAAGNPFDPVVPVRIVVPRNGVGNGVTVLSGPAGLREVRAQLAPLQGPGGATLPVRIRYGVQGSLHWCDELHDQPPVGAKTLPVWLEANAAKDQRPGSYTGTLSLSGNGRQFTVPVEVLVSAFTLPASRDLRSQIFAMHSPEALAKAYNLKPWSPEHFQKMEQSLTMVGQLGNDVMVVPVMVGGHMAHETGLVRWTKAGPDFTLFEKYLDLYVKYCAPPKAISFYIWSADTVTDVADGYENRRIPSQASKPRRPLLVTQWDPATGVTTNVPAPTFLDPDGGAFWKPFFTGVRNIVVNKRGWSERVIMIGIGSDIRPSQRTGELLRQWVPYARWHLQSHFSADGAPKDGKLFVVGGLETGLKEAPGNCATPQEHSWSNLIDYVFIPLNRGGPGVRGSPHAYRMEPMAAGGRWARLGVDFWPEVVRYGGMIWGSTPSYLTARGPAGPLPTVRLQMIREGLQDFEARLVIEDAIAKLPADRQQPYRALLADQRRRDLAGGYVWGWFDLAVPATELSLDWQAYAAKLHAAAAELSAR